MNDAEKLVPDKRITSSSENGIGIGAAIGTALGAAYGASSGNMGPSLAMGLALGTAVGAIFDFKQRGQLKASNSGK